MIGFDGCAVQLGIVFDPTIASGPDAPQFVQFASLRINGMCLKVEPR
jgi:hypothetical protein